MARKGILQEIFSKALYADNASRYIVTFRDFEEYRSVNLLEFISISENFQTIPASRIRKIELDGQILYEKN